MRETRAAKIDRLRRFLTGRVRRDKRLRAAERELVHTVLAQLDAETRAERRERRAGA